jgi:hypothetical protein
VKRSRVAKAALKPASNLITLGLPSLKQSGGRINEEWRERLRGPRKFKVYREMADADSTVGGFIWNLILFILRVEWTVTPPEVDGEVSPEAQALAERVQGAWEDMEQEPSKTLAEIVRHAARDGAAPMEVTLKICRGTKLDEAGNEVTETDPVLASDFSDGFVGWRSWSIRPLESVTEWLWDPQNKSRLLGFVQTADEDYRARTIPMEKVLLFQFITAKNSPEGISMLSWSERDYYFKKHYEEVGAIGIKRELCGMPVARVPATMMSPNATPEQQAVLEEIKLGMQLIEADELGCLVFPGEKNADGTESGFDVYLMASGGSRAIDISAEIRRLRSQISVALGGAFMYAGLDGSSARSLDESKTDTFKLAVMSMLRSIKQVLDVAVVRLMQAQPVPPPREIWPTFEHSDIDEATMEQFGAYLRNMMDAGAITYSEEIEAEALRKGGLKPKRVDHALEVIQGGVDDTGATPANEAVPAAETALNGAQVTSALEIVAEVAAGRLPRATGVAMLQEFFNMEAARAERIMGRVGLDFVPTPEDGAEEVIAAKEGEEPPPTYSKDDLRALMTEAEVRKLLSVGKVGLASLVAEGKIRAFTIAGRRKYDPKDVHEMLLAAGGATG